MRFSRHGVRKAGWHTTGPIGGPTAGIESEILVEDLSLGGALLALQAPLLADGEVMLALRGRGPRPQGVLLPSRVVRVAEGPAPGRTPFRAAVHFRPEARLRVAALLAGSPATESRG